MKHFTLDRRDDGITVVTFDRKPVNAVSNEVYHEIKEWADELSDDDSTRVVILTAPDDARAFCGGADVNEFLELDYETRLQRYETIHSTLPSLYHLEKPVIAAINKPAVGVGLVISSFCDIRIASEDAFFAAPEVDRGLVAALGPLTRIGLPNAIINEMLYTARRFSARELEGWGFLNYVLPEAEVKAKAFEIAELIAKKSLPALRANKFWAVETQGMFWQDAYRATHEASAQLTAGSDSKEGIRAFLEGREANYADR